MSAHRWDESGSPVGAAWTPPDWWQHSPWEAFDALDPTAVAELRRGIDYLHGGTPRSCAHPADPLWLCGMHPALGVACFDCLGRHLRRHSHEEEHRCDGCGGQAETMIPLLAQLPRPRWRRPPRSGKVRNTSAVVLSGLGFCEPCAAGLGFPVGRAA